MKRSALLPFAACATLALILAGCAKDDAQSGSATNDGDYVPGPLDEYMTVLWEGEDWSIEKAKEQDRQREDLVAECMAKEGFEYVPNTNNVSYGEEVDDSEGPQWGSKEFAEQYGYGIVDWPGRQEMENQDPEEYFDPNQDYVTSLSESEQQAFYDTLYGKGPTEEEWALIESGEMEYQWEDQGCDGWARHQLNEGTSAGLWEDPEFEEMTSAMNEMYTEIYSDPEYQTLNQEWVSCMADAGFSDVKDKDNVQNALYDELNEIYEDSSSPTGEWSEPDKSVMDEFQKKEITQAVADYDCSQSVEYDKRYTEINHRMQQDFLNQYKTQLDAAIAKYSNKNS